MRVFCSWYLRRRAQRGQPFTTDWQPWWKTVLHWPHLEESGKCCLCQWADGLPWGLRLPSVSDQSPQSDCVLATTPGLQALLHPATKDSRCNAYPRSCDARCTIYFIFYKYAETH